MRVRVRLLQARPKPATPQHAIHPAGTWTGLDPRARASWVTWARRPGSARRPWSSPALRAPRPARAPLRPPQPCNPTAGTLPGAARGLGAGGRWRRSSPEPRRGAAGGGRAWWPRAGTRGWARPWAARSALPAAGAPARLSRRGRTPRSPARLFAVPTAHTPGRTPISPCAPAGACPGPRASHSCPSALLRPRGPLSQRPRFPTLPCACIPVGASAPGPGVPATP